MTDDLNGDSTGDSTGDQLPEDLDVTAYVGPYVFPDIKRRRIAGTIYAVLGALGVVGRARGFEQRPAVRRGPPVGDRRVPLRRGLAAEDRPDRSARGREPHGRIPGRACVGAARVARTPLSRPAWRILVYSADEPPSMRGLVELDAVDGHVLGEYTEHNPEDWSNYPR